jgi:hypothetical protein
MAANVILAGGVAGPPNPPNGQNDRAFYVVFAVVFAITVTCLGLGLWKAAQRTQYVNTETTRLISQTPKGDVGSPPSSNDPDRKTDLEREKDIFNEERNAQENTITILFGVFQAGTGAIIGLLTGKGLSK